MTKKVPYQWSPTVVKIAIEARTAAIFSHRQMRLKCNSRNRDLQSSRTKINHTKANQEISKNFRIKTHQVDSNKINNSLKMFTKMG